MQPIKKIAKAIQNSIMKTQSQQDDDIENEIDEQAYESQISQGSSNGISVRRAVQEEQDDQEEQEDAAVAASAAAVQHEQTMNGGEQGEEGADPIQKFGGDGGGGDDDGEGEGGDDEDGEKKGKFAKAKEKIGQAKESINELKGAYGDWKKKRENKKKLKKLKKNVKKDEKKDNKKGAYRRNFIPENHLLQMTNREVGEPVHPLTDRHQKFQDKMKEKQDLAKKIKSTPKEEANNVDKLQEDYEKKEGEVKQEGRTLLKELLKADIKRGLEGPSGCVKDCKSGCLTMNVIGLFVIGGFITAILKICGLF